MDQSVRTLKNITGLSLIALGATLSAHSLLIPLDTRTRTIRWYNGVRSLHVIFNFLKLSILKYFLVKYRHLVQSGQLALLDSALPP